MTYGRQLGRHEWRHGGSVFRSASITRPTTYRLQMDQPRHKYINLYGVDKHAWDGLTGVRERARYVSKGKIGTKTRRQRNLMLAGSKGY